MIFWALLFTTQTTFELNTLRQSPHGDAFVTVESGAIVPSFDVRAGVFLNYAYRPLQLVDGSGSRRGTLIDHRLDLAFLASVSLFDRLSIGLSVPATLYQVGRLTDVAVPTVSFGDIKLSPKVGLLDQQRHIINLAITAMLSIPSSTHGSFAGDRNVTAGGELDISRSGLGPVRLGLNVGYLWRLPTYLYDLRVGPELYARAGIGVQLPVVPVEMIGEVFGRTSAFAPFRSEAESPVEWLIAARYTPHCWVHITGGFGRGLVGGYGAPAARGLLGVMITPFAKCGETPASAPAPVPLENPDLDGDGILNADDKCPTVPEDKDGYEDEDGCPDPVHDTDKDGVPDDVDKCPNEKEDLDGFNDEDGCPDPDNDADGLKDEVDQCPNEPETINGVKDDDGCPDEGRSLVVVKSDSIQILEKIQFARGSDKILPASFGLLDQVASVLRNHSEIGRLKIEGHTDSDGPDAANLKLSQRRAESVRRYLVDHGVEAGRLDAIGYGETRPMAPNSSKRGKEMNRRVAFTIVSAAASQPATLQAASQPATLPASQSATGGPATGEARPQAATREAASEPALLAPPSRDALPLQPSKR